MHLTLHPCQGIPGHPETSITVEGETIAIDGVSFDLSAVPEGGEGRLVAEGDRAGSPFIGPITRRAGIIHASILVLLDDTAAEFQPDQFFVIEDARGHIAIPAFRKGAGA